VTAAAYDIQLEQGETWNPVWTLTVAGGVPLNLTGYQAHLQIRSTYYSTAVLVDLHSSTGGLKLGGAAGTVQPYLPATTSAALLSGQVPLSQTLNGRAVYKLGAYDLKLTDQSGNVTTIMGGNAWIAPQVTVGGA
jgi:hypothetical protein